jgi:hypothetical protein
MRTALGYRLRPILTTFVDRVAARLYPVILALTAALTGRA